MAHNTASYEKIVIRRFGGPEKLKLEHASLPTPPKGSSLVKVVAAGIGYTDVMARKGEYLFQRKQPFTPGYELAGVITATDISDSNATSELKIGVRVAACLPYMAGYTQYIVVPNKFLVVVPGAISLEVAASMSLNYLTALAMLERSVQLKPDDSILVQGAAGGVGEALCQLGKHRGLTMYGTASSDSFERLRRYGVVPIDYKNQDFKEVMYQKQPNGVQAVFDHIGGKNLTDGYAVLAPGGTLVSYAFMGRSEHVLADTIRGAAHNMLLNLLPGKHTRIFSILPLIKSKPEWYRDALTRLFAYTVNGEIAPRFAHSFALQDAASAHRLLESHKATGKIILLPNKVNR